VQRTCLLSSTKAEPSPLVDRHGAKKSKPGGPHNYSLGCLFPVSHMQNGLDRNKIIIITYRRHTARGKIQEDHREGGEQTAEQWSTISVCQLPVPAAPPLYSQPLKPRSSPIPFHLPPSFLHFGSNNPACFRSTPSIETSLLLREFSAREAMASTSGSTTAVEEREMEWKRKRAAAGVESAAAVSKWRTRREHEIYSSKLLEALRLVRAGPSSSPSSSATATAPPRSRAVREAADRALAVAARGRTCWSRAILANRRRLQAARRARLRNPASPSSRHALVPATAASSVSAQLDGKKTPPLARKAKVLGRLVPGCRKLPFPALLTEASDYIAALEMQVRAMTALAEALSAVSSSGSGSSPPPPA
jgi:hypothetical protein